MKVRPWAGHRTEHIPAEDEGTKIRRALPGKLVVDIDRSTFLPLHRAKCFCVDEPLEDFGSAFAQWIIRALLRSRAETIQ
jgi:hypothetical protein